MEGLDWLLELVLLSETIFLVVKQVLRFKNQRSETRNISELTKMQYSSTEYQRGYISLLVEIDS